MEIKMEYIDVRGAYPIYFKGFKSLRLPTEARGWKLTDESTRLYISLNL